MRVEKANIALDMLRENDPQKMCFTYLSENETLPSTRAAEEDGLHAWFGKIHAGEELDQVATHEARVARHLKLDFALYPPITTNADAATTAALAWAKSFGPEKSKGDTKYARVLNCRFARLYFLTLSRLPAHFRATKDLVMATVLQRHTGYMGVSCYSIATLRYYLFLYPLARRMYNQHQLGSFRGDAYALSDRRSRSESMGRHRAAGDRRCVRAAVRQVRRDEPEDRHDDEKLSKCAGAVRAGRRQRRERGSKATAASGTA